MLAWFKLTIYVNMSKNNTNEKILTPYIVIKDKNLAIIDCNQHFLADHRLKKSTIMGKTLAQAIEDPYGYLDQAYDRDILSGKSYFAIHLCKDPSGKCRFFHKRSQVYYNDQGILIGIKTILYCAQMTKLNDLIKDINYINQDYTCHYAHIGQEGLFANLTCEQSRVFFYLIRGLSIEVIATKLKKSSKSVTELRNLVLFKTKTKSISELFVFAGTHNLLCNVPHSLLEPMITAKKIPLESENPRLIQTTPMMVKLISKPVLTDGIDFFAYIKSPRKGRAVCLSTLAKSESFLKKYGIVDNYSALKKHCNKSVAHGTHNAIFTFLRAFDQTQTNWFFEEHWPKSALILGMVQKDYIELFCFGSSNALFDLKKYQALTTTLTSFCWYFKGQAKALIHEAEEAKIRCKNYHDPSADILINSHWIAAALLLSTREFEVLFKVARNTPSKIIGTELGVSEKTINEYVRRLRVKLKCHTTYELTRTYWEIDDQKNVV